MNKAATTRRSFIQAVCAAVASVAMAVYCPVRADVGDPSNAWHGSATSVTLMAGGDGYRLTGFTVNGKPCHANDDPGVFIKPGDELWLGFTSIENPYLRTGKRLTA